MNPSTTPTAPLVVRLRDIMPNALAGGDLAREARALLALHRIREAATRLVQAEHEADATDELYATRTYGAPIADFTPTVVVPPEVLERLRVVRATYRPAGRLRRLVGRGSHLRVTGVRTV
jgi:hypothetical protein